MTNLKHEVTQIAPKTWCISEFRLVNAFLVEGDEKAALIDTGCGIGNIAQVVHSLTDKPVTILLSHGHFDHDGGVFEFPDADIYLHPADGNQRIEMTHRLGEMFGVEDENQLRAYYVKSRAPIRYPEAKLEDLLQLVPREKTPDTYVWKPLADGMEFDLGGRVLQVIHTPGHSDGEVCFLDKTSRTLFSGDTANAGIILMRQPNNDTALIKICNQTMKKLWALSADYDKLGVGHDAVTVDKQIIKDYLDLTNGLLDGTITGAYEETGFRKGDVARLGLAELWYQCDA